MKSMAEPSNKFLFQGRQKLMSLPFSKRHNITKREMKMAVKSDVRIPRPSVVAKPRMGPEPNK